MTDTDNSPQTFAPCPNWCTTADRHSWEDMKSGLIRDHEAPLTLDGMSEEDLGGLSLNFHAQDTIDAQGLRVSPTTVQLWTQNGTEPVDLTAVQARALSAAFEALAGRLDAINDSRPSQSDQR